MRKIFSRRDTFGLRNRRRAEEEKEENIYRWKRVVMSAGKKEKEENIWKWKKISSECCKRFAMIEMRK